MVSLDNFDKLIVEMPKTELHLHLEGAIPLGMLFNLIEKRGGDPSVSSLEDLERNLVYILILSILSMRGLGRILSLKKKGTLRR